MPRFKVGHRYASSLGTWTEGAEVEMDAELAAHVNRDSPGTLIPLPEERAPSAPPADRMMKGRGRRG